MEYADFLQTKKKGFVSSGFELDESYFKLNAMNHKSAVIEKESILQLF